MSFTLKTGVENFFTQTLSAVKVPTWGETGPSYENLYVNIPCRFVEESEWIRGDQQNEILTTAYLYVSADYNIEVGQQLEIETRTFKVIKVSVNRDETGAPVFLKVWVA